MSAWRSENSGREAAKASQSGHENRMDKLVKLVYKGADLQQTDSLGRTALLQAAENGNIEMLEFLIHQGADVRDLDNNGCNALIRASIHGRDAMVRELLSIGLDPNESDNDGSTLRANGRDTAAS
nr:ankyrin repeat domain-containing protein [Paenibacillus sambharensis]